jgi:hypothetical protein
VASYVYGNSVISQTRRGVPSYYLVDGLGSTRALTDATGRFTDRYIYDAFGRTISQTGSTIKKTDGTHATPSPYALFDSTPFLWRWS